MKLQWFAWVILLSFCVAPALAHEAASGFSYDADCCSGHDCQQVPEEAVKETSGGYQISIPAGVHKMAPEGVNALVPYRNENGDWNQRIRPSGDDHPHVCIHPYSKQVLCIYVRPGGV